jgi:small-conductance mechanosensitive channel
MAECKDIDRALANLGRKIDAQNKCCEANKKAINDLKNRIGNLERGNRNQPKDKVDLTSINRRLSAIERYINILDGTGNALKAGLEQIRNLFLGD